jgi:hypothetical protein
MTVPDKLAGNLERNPPKWIVIPAQAGSQGNRHTAGHRTPAFAGATNLSGYRHSRWGNHRRRSHSAAFIGAAQS